MECIGRPMVGLYRFCGYACLSGQIADVILIIRIAENAELSGSIVRDRLYSKSLLSAAKRLENCKKFSLTVPVAIGRFELGEFEFDVFVETKN